MFAVIYKTHTGEITQVIGGGSEEELQSTVEGNIKADETLIWVEDPFDQADYCVVAGDLTAKLAMSSITYPGAIKVDEIATIAGLPDNCTVQWPDLVETEESNSFTFEAGLPGEYLFRIYHPQYRGVEATIDVT